MIELRFFGGYTVEETAEAADHEPRCHEQHHGQRRFSDHQPVAQMTRRVALVSFAARARLAPRAAGQSVCAEAGSDEEAAAALAPRPLPQ